MDDTSIVVLRHFQKDQDSPFIYATWRNSWYYGLKTKPKESPQLSFIKKTAEIKEVLEIAKVIIACLEDSPEIIIGYAISTGNELNWIYVKKDYRKKGIGKLLMSNTGEKNVRRTENRQTNQGI